MLYPRSIRFTLLAGGLWLGLAWPSHADLLTFDLGPPSVTPEAATFDVLLTFDGEPGDLVEVVQLSVWGSHPLLTDGDTDFGRFQFRLDPSLDGWIELAPLDALGVGLYGPSDPTTGPFLTPSAAPYTLGRLRVDLTGFAIGTELFVTLAGGPAGLDTDAAGTLGGDDVGSFAALGQVAFANPAGVAFTVIPEPGSLMLLIAGGLGLCVVRRCPRARGRARPCAAGSLSELPRP